MAEADSALAALLPRFRAGLAATGAKPVPGRPLGLAVSGGPDSLALLLLAHAALPGMVAVATVDHGLRPAAADEAREVARVCSLMAIPHAVLRPPEPPTGSLQSAARSARYALLHEWAEREGLVAVCTGHHADDQLETLLMRLARGSGVGGMAGIRPRNGIVARPLLGMTRAELALVVAEAGLEPADDPSNRDPRFDRARMRAALAGTGLDPLAATRTASALAEAEEALAFWAAQEARARIRAEGAALYVNGDGLPRELQRRLLLAAMERLGAPPPRGEALDRALALLAAGRRAVLADLLCDPEPAAGRAVWHVRAAPPRRLPRSGN